MTTPQLEGIIYQKPFQPFRLVLDNGEEVIVQRPRKASVSGDQIALVGLTKRPGGAGREGLRIIRLARIISPDTVQS
jgi:hypothetical protein